MKPQLLTTKLHTKEEHTMQQLEVYDHITVDIDSDISDISPLKLLEMIANDDYEIEVDLTLDVDSIGTVNIDHSFGAQIRAELNKSAVLDALESNISHLLDTILSQAETIKKLRDEIIELKESSTKPVEVLRPVG